MNFLNQLSIVKVGSGSGSGSGSSGYTFYCLSFPLDVDMWWFLVKCMMFTAYCLLPNCRRGGLQPFPPPTLLSVIPLRVTGVGAGDQGTVWT
jgi:hypothetical protein